MVQPSKFAVVFSTAACTLFLGIGSDSRLRAESEPGQWMCPPLPSPGWPRSWQTGIKVSTYSMANAQDRNLITTIPIISWSGVGPDINMMLYHNSASTNSTIDITRGLGFGLGPGWTTSYSAQLILEELGIRVMWDDQSQDI